MKNEEAIVDISESLISLSPGEKSKVIKKKGNFIFFEISSGGGTLIDLTYKKKYYFSKKSDMENIRISGYEFAFLASEKNKKPLEILIAHYNIDLLLLGRIF